MVCLFAPPLLISTNTTRCGLPSARVLVQVYKSSSAAYGGNSLKSDFGGHSNYHHDNLDLFYGTGFGIVSQLPGYADGEWRPCNGVQTDRMQLFSSPILRFVLKHSQYRPLLSSSPVLQATTTTTCT